MKLNLCSGGNVFPGWTNLDRTDVEDQYLRHLRGLTDEQVATWPANQRALVAALREGNMRFFQWDVRRGLPMYENRSASAIYLGQCVEHFHPLTELPALLAECHRVLEPGGVVRITTPDLHKLLLAYTEHRMSEFEAEQPEFFRILSPAGKLSAILFGASGPECTRENYEGHFMCWTSEDLIAEFGAAGLPAHVATEPSEVFRECHDYGLSHSMALEAVKP